jgi:ribosomal protein S18 acetylase RimI-like enzyme
MKLTLSYETIMNPSPADLEFIGKGVAQQNIEAYGSNDSERVAIFVRDENQAIVGGVSGLIRWNWLHVQGLWVDKTQRGRNIGTQLMRMIEDEAAARGIRKVQVETLSFQAIGFYLKSGYEVFAQLDDKPPGHTWYYLKKELSVKTEQNN